MKIVKALKTTLYTPLSSSGTSIVLKKFVDLDGVELAMSDFGDFGVVVLKQGDTVEMIKFSALSQSSTDTTCTITVASSGRSIAGTSPYAGASTGESFNAGAEVIVTNDPLTLSRFANLDIAQTFEQIMTFAALPRTTAGNPIDANDLARKAYVDSVVAGIATTVNLIVPGVAGETVAAGNLIYLKATDGRWWKCDADTATTVENVNLGIAQGAGTAGVAITNGVLTQGLDANQSGLTASTKYYAGNTAGAISTSAGTKEVTIGFSHPTDATKLYFQPRFDQQLTENQQDLVEQIEAGTDFYAASAVGTDAYAITIAPAITAYTTGMKFRFKADVANTGACTLAVSGLSALAIKKLNDQDLVTGDIEVGQIVEVVYDGTDFQMQSQTAQLIGDGSALTGIIMTTSLVAGEAITQGKPVFISRGTEEKEVYNAGITNFGVNNWGDITANTKMAISFTVGAVDIVASKVAVSLGKAGSPTDNVTLSIQANSAGSPSGTPLASVTFDGSTLPVTQDFQTKTFSASTVLTASTAYFLVMERVNAVDPVNYYKLGAAGGSNVNKYNGSAWSGASYGSHMTITSIYTSGKAYLTNAAVSTMVQSFLGFASATVATGETLTIKTVGIDSLQSGLTVGNVYYLADSYGGIQTSAGSNSRKVGIAISTTQILITNIW